jgi:hypothetical protein
VAALTSAVVDTYTLLIVSKDHMQDVVPKSAEDSQARFVAAVEKFPFLAIVDTPPYEIEPWTKDAVDIGLRPIGNVGELLKHPKARPQLEELSIAQDREHAAIAASQDQLRVGTRLSSRGKRLFLQCCITLLSGWMGTDVNEILAMWETESGTKLADEERTSILGTIGPWAAWLRDVERKHTLTEDDRQKLLLGFRDSFDDTSRVRSPGMYLARKLARCLHTNVGRKPLRSDSVDGMHASYFPYVDVATCDSGTFACLSGHIGTIKGSRSPRLYRNNDLKAVVDAIGTVGLAAPAGCCPTSR